MGATIVEADGANAEQMRLAFEGSWGAFINIGTEGYGYEGGLRLGINVLSAAAAAGVKHIVFSSAPAVSRLTGGQIPLSHLDTKAGIEEWGRNNSDFETFTPVMASWYLENFKDPAYAELFGGFPTAKDGDGYLTFRTPLWGGNESVGWISIEQDFGDLVHGVFLNPVRWNLQVIQCHGDLMSFSEMTHTFTKVTGKKARFLAFVPVEAMPSAGFPEIQYLFQYAQLREGEFYGNGPNEIRTASQLKRAAFKAKGESHFTTTSNPMTMTKGASPKLERLNAKAFSKESQLIEQAIESIKVSGACIIEQLLDLEIVEQIKADIAPYLPNAGLFEGYELKGSQVTGLMSKSETYALEVVGNPVWTGVRDYFLTKPYGPIWACTGVQASFSNGPQLDTTAAFLLKPGSPDQQFHRDDQVHLNWQKEAKEYELGRDTGAAIFVSLGESTRENGTTRLIPGSHLWDYATQCPTSDDPRIVYAEMKPGDCFIMLTSLLHAGSPNVSKDKDRLLVANHSTLAHLRQEENQYLCNDPEKVKKFPVWLQRYMGYSTAQPYCGWVDKKDPLRVINPEAKEYVDGWRAEWRKAPPKVPTDTVMPLHLWNCQPDLQDYTEIMTYKFDSVLDYGILRKSLERLVELEGWRKLGARLRRNSAGQLEYHIPAQYTPERPGVIITQKQHDESIVAHPVSQYFPTATNTPSLHAAETQEMLPYVTDPSGPKHFDEWLSQDLPQLVVHVVSFHDATVLSLIFPTTLADASSVGYILTAWTAIIRGQEDEVPKFLGYDQDPLASFGQHGEPKKFVYHNRIISSLGMVAIVANYLLDLFRFPKYSKRLLCLPGQYVDELRRDILQELKKAAEGEETPFVSEGDVLLAWWTNMSLRAYQASPRRTLMVANVMSVRPHYVNIPNSVYVGNAGVVYYTITSVSQALGRGVGFLAHEMRKALLCQKEREQIEANAAMTKQNGRTPLIGHWNMKAFACSNWTKGKYFHYDFSAAVVRAPKSVETSSESQPAGLPSIWVQNVWVNKGQPLRWDGLVIMGKDLNGNWWLDSIMAEKAAQRLEQHLSSPYPHTWDSFLTYSGIPVEFSVNYSQNGSPTARIGWEPISHATGTARDPFNQATVAGAVARLSSLRLGGYSSELVAHFMNTLTVNSEEIQRVGNKELPVERYKNQVALGLDLKNNDVAVKCYVYPALKAYVSGRSFYDLLHASISKMDNPTQWALSLPMVHTYLTTAQLYNHFSFIGFDCTTPSKSRLKVYNTITDVSWNKVEDIWTLGGRIAQQKAIQQGLDLLRKLWQLLNSRREAMAVGIWSYELSPGSAAITPKWYLILQGLNDMEIARGLVEYFKFIGKDGVASSYIQTLASYFPGEDLNTTTHLIQYVSFAFSEKTGAYLSIYYHSMQ
ncbi:hypothetical protein CFD26_102971 [Aspergillus turcosus]|uniref:NmrA-like domain-containing protein n=1 Tax=Aspergillus turcosus TaxID=1245748 RepID=A0A3R7IJR4_9EURO|nr:hypothetical protein CFD26_102971 [Aspergillus turcosus]